jgi:hypothetical protein
MKTISETIQTTLNINHPTLASLIGITEQSLTEFENLESLYQAPKKAGRLILLGSFLGYITEFYPQIKSESYLEILYNERIVFDPSDLEDGDCSLINFINANNKNISWKLILSQILDERLKLL